MPEPPTPVEAPPEAVTSVEVTSETTDDAMRTDDESSQDMPAVIKDVVSFSSNVKDFSLYNNKKTVTCRTEFISR